MANTDASYSANGSKDWRKIVISQLRNRNKSQTHAFADLITLRELLQLNLLIPSAYILFCFFNFHNLIYSIKY